MKKSRAMIIVASTLAVLIAIAGASYAWFLANLDGITVKGNAAYLNMENKNEEAVTFDFHEVLPGEKIKMTVPESEPGVQVKDVIYTSNRSGIIEFSIGAFAKNLKAIELTRTDTKWKALWTSYDPVDYVQDTATSQWWFTAKRVREVLKIEIGGTTATPAFLEAVYYDNTTKVKTTTTVLDAKYMYADATNGFVYVYVPVNEAGATINGNPVTVQRGTEYVEVNLLKDSAVAVHVLGELGGSYKGTNATISADRQWEQEVVFGVDGAADNGMGLTITAVQATKEAVTDVFGGGNAALAGRIETGLVNATTQPAWGYTGN